MKGQQMLSEWEGTPISELSREELLGVVSWCGEEITRLREENMRNMSVLAPQKARH
jgi:hypothetical protein